MANLPQVVQKAFRPLFGKPCWGAKHGHGSFITFEFGEPHLQIREPCEPDPSRSPKVRKLLQRRQVNVHGEWHLWIYCCDWLATVNGERVGESGSVPRMEQAVRELDGQAFVGIDADLDLGRWYFDFDLGGRLETRPYSSTGEPDEVNEQWMLYEPDGRVLTMRSDGSYSHQPGDTPREQTLWVLPGE